MDIPTPTIPQTDPTSPQTLPQTNPTTSTTTSTLSADDFVPFNPPIEFQKCTKVIRSTFDDLPSFSSDAVLLISKLASDTIERLVSTAYSTVQDNTKDNAVPTITASALKDVVDNDMLTYSHFEDLVDRAKLEPGARKAGSRKARKIMAGTSAGGVVGGETKTESSLQDTTTTTTSSGQGTFTSSSSLPSSTTPAPDLGPPTATLTVPFSPAIDFTKTTKMIRSSYPDLPSFSKDAVSLIGALVADQVKDIVEIAHGMGGGEEGGVRRIGTEDIKKAVLDNENRFGHLTSTALSAKSDVLKKSKSRVRRPIDPTSPSPSSLPLSSSLSIPAPTSNNTLSMSLAPSSSFYQDSTNQETTNFVGGIEPVPVPGGGYGEEADLGDVDLQLDTDDYDA